MAISALQQAVPLAWAADTPAGTQAAPLLNWCTAEVEPKDRFDHWRAVRAKALFGATVELEAELRPRFSGEFSLRNFGSAGLMRLRASPYHIERSPADIADDPRDSLCIYQQLGGGGWFRVGGSEDFIIRCGNFATGYSDLPYDAAPLTDDGFDLCVLKVPVADILGEIAGPPRPRRKTLQRSRPAWSVAGILLLRFNRGR